VNGYRSLGKYDGQEFLGEIQRKIIRCTENLQWNRKVYSGVQKSAVLTERPVTRAKLLLIFTVLQTGDIRVHSRALIVI